MSPLLQPRIPPAVPATEPSAGLNAVRLERRVRGPGVAGLWSQVQALSLDVTFGVLCAAVLAASVTGASMPAIWWFLLPACTWAVYAADHLLDARRVGAAARSARHRLFSRYRRVLAWHVGGVVGTAALAALCWWPRSLWMPAIGLAAATLAHLLAAQVDGRAPWPKELSAALIYTSAIWFAPLLLAPAHSPRVLPLIGLHFLAALLNLMMGSLFEYRTDEIEGHRSIARSWGPGRVRAAVGLLTVVGAAGGLIVLAAGPPRRWAAVAVLLSLVLLPGVMIRNADYFARHERYRLYGDLAFAMLVLPAWGGHVTA